MFQNKTKLKSILQFVFVFLLVCFALFVTYYGQEVRRYNTTILAFNYSYGFISRGLLGTLYLGLDALIPKDIINYVDAANITFIATNVIMGIFFFLALYILLKTKEKYLNGAQNILLFFAIFFVPMYYSLRNMGRPDIYMLFLTFLGLILLIWGKMEWLIIPFSIFNVMIHQGYVFLFYNIFMYPLIYKIFQTTGKKQKKYIAILATSFLSVSVLFLYFNFFSHISGQETYDSIYAMAAQLGNGGEVYETLLTHEILGIDPWDQEWPQHIYNFIELPIYCLIMSPFIVLGVRLFRNIITAAETKVDKIKYALLPLCSATILPCYILKIDFGRWIFAGLSYFALVVLVLYALHDEIVTEQVEKLIADVQARYAYAPLLLVYAATTIPLHDIHINEIMRSISEWLDYYYLHIIA
ncbi:MAG: hypothetical protein IJ455_00190 [Agathobacter sp.]|nr:hypothetical protein [Agathobacter sp.]